MPKKSENRDLILYLSYTHKGKWNEIYKSLVNKDYKDITDEEIEGIKNSLTCDFITILDKEYPDYLKQGYHPPFVLFYKGDIGLLKDKSKTRLAILSTKEQSVEDYNIADYVLDNVDEDIVFITGGTTELDSTIAIKGNPVIEVLPYPVENVPYGKLNQVLRNGGLFVSEYPMNTLETSDNYLARNRIIATFAHYVLILSCKQQSGSLTVVSYALEQGKDILVVPQSPIRTNLINNRLIYDGAIPVWDSESLNTATKKW